MTSRRAARIRKPSRGVTRDWVPLRLSVWMGKNKHKSRKSPCCIMEQTVQTRRVYNKTCRRERAYSKHTDCHFI